MTVTSLRYFWYVLFFAAFFINENLIRWALAVIVGNYSVKDGFIDAFEYFTIEGYAFFTAISYDANNEQEIT